MLGTPAGARRLLVWALVAVVFQRGTLVAQGPSPRYTSGWWDVVSVAGGTAVAGVGILVTPPSASCAPCDRATLPGIDRWALAHHSAVGGPASTVLLLGVGGGAALAAITGVSPSRARGDAAVLANAVAWTAATTEWLKVGVHRARPALYRSGAEAAAAIADNRKSFPSEHTSLAFAAATAYATMATRQQLPHATRNTVLLYSGAVGTGILRVLGGKHFPTDVLGGAALGAGVGWITARLHPTTP